MEKYFSDSGIPPAVQKKMRADAVVRPEMLLSSLQIPGHEEVCTQSCALYWRALVQLLDKESSRLGVTAHPSLLGSESFHKSLLACATETVLKAHSLITLTFQILDTFDISAIEFFKVLESFVLVTHNLPTALKRHLNRVYEMILEQYAWVSSSPLFAMIEKQKEQNMWPVESIAPPNAMSEDDDAAVAPPAGSGRPKGSDKSLEMFFEKLLALCRVIIFDLSHALGEQLLEARPFDGAENDNPEAAPGTRVTKEASRNDGPSIKDQVYATMKACLADHYFVLCRNRSILHTILCTFYGVCKVNKLEQEVKFQTIIQTYQEDAAWRKRGYRSPNSSGG